MKFLGIDYGSKHIGIAVSDEEGKIAFPRTTLSNDSDVFKAVDALITHEKIGIVVIGDTRASGGVENPITTEADAFADRIAKDQRVQVERVWELWSSIEASRYAPTGKEHDNAAAAAIILQRFLDSRAARL